MSPFGHSGMFTFHIAAVVGSRSRGKTVLRVNLRYASFTYPGLEPIHLVLELSVSTGILKLAAELLVESRAAQGAPNY